MWKWLVAGTLAFGIAPGLAQAQMRFGRVGQPRMPVNGFGNMRFPVGVGFPVSGFQPGSALFMRGFPLGTGLGASAYLNRYAMYPYTNPYLTSYGYMMNPYMSGYTYGYGYGSGGYGSGGYGYGSGYGSGGYGSGYGSGSASGYNSSGASAGYGGAGYGQAGSGQTASIEPSVLFGLPAANGHLQWPLGLRTLAPANETKALRQQLDLVLAYVATQAAAGQVNNAFIDEGLQAVREFRRLLRPHEGAMADTTYTDASRFLDRAERGLTKIRNIKTNDGGAGQ